MDESGAPVGPSDAEIKYRLNFPGAEVRIASVPNNVGSFDETVLNGGPWTTVATRANLATRLSLIECATAGPGNATLTARGVPSDADVAAANRTHEDRHATDHSTVFNAIMVPWDNALTQALNNRRSFRGADQAAAEAELFRSVGGTPDQIATNLWTTWTGTGDAFHATPNGGPLRLSNPVSDPGCTTVTVDVRQ